MEKQNVTISVEDLAIYIIKQGDVMERELKKARKKFGNRYDWHNKFERAITALGTPYDTVHAVQWAQEYFLIIQKKSKLPATVRYVVRDIGHAAMNHCYSDKMAALRRVNKLKETEKKKDNQD